jgi:hypothetical protein
MTNQDHRDQDAEPPTPDGKEPETVKGSEPGSDPDPDPGASADQAGKDG